MGLHDVQLQQKWYANLWQQDAKLNEDDQVLLSTTNPALLTLSKKLSAKFKGPFTISKCISTVAYWLELPGMICIHPVFHISQLRQYEDPTDHHNLPPKQAPLTINSELKYEVQDIMQKCIWWWCVEYLVCWQGYPNYNVTWEPLSNLCNTQQIVEDFESVGCHSPKGRMV